MVFHDSRLENLVIALDQLEFVEIDSSNYDKEHNEAYVQFWTDDSTKAGDLLRQVKRKTDSCSIFAGMEIREYKHKNQGIKLRDSYRFKYYHQKENLPQGKKKRALERAIEQSVDAIYELIEEGY